ncbi:hypothetical protein [Arachnia propionica]|uniref:Uncharacterized protein n=1 Tax=Arachnia propionica TaxID=1750 RepID=A0AB37HVV2_9ACTN|nr:hypothetical protein [Arachnia propionica]QUC10970.1 hypothetical protein J5A53_14625 [Arachnia propionica]
MSPAAGKAQIPAVPQHAMSSSCPRALPSRIERRTRFAVMGAGAATSGVRTVGAEVVTVGRSSSWVSGMRNAKVGMTVTVMVATASTRAEIAVTGASVTANKHVRTPASPHKAAMVELRADLLSTNHTTSAATSAVHAVAARASRGRDPASVGSSAVPQTPIRAVATRRPGAVQRIRRHLSDHPSATVQVTAADPLSTSETGHQPRTGPARHAVSIPVTRVRNKDSTSVGRNHGEEARTATCCATRSLSAGPVSVRTVPEVRSLPRARSRSTGVPSGWVRHSVSGSASIRSMDITRATVVPTGTAMSCFEAP